MSGMNGPPSDREQRLEQAQRIRDMIAKATVELKNAEAHVARFEAERAEAERGLHLATRVRLQILDTLAELEQVKAESDAGLRDLSGALH